MYDGAVGSASLLFPHISPGACSAAFTCTFSTQIHLFLLSASLSFSCRSTQAARRVNACARAAGRGCQQAQVPYLHATFYSNT